MKSWVLMTLFVCLIIFSYVFPFRSAFLDNQTHQVTVGPNQTYLWTSDHTLSRSVEDTFYLKSSTYFELNGQIVKQAVYEEPVLGEDSGLYWIRDFPMSGAWNISNPATIFSLEEETTLTVSTSFWYKLVNYVFAFIGSFVLLAFSFLFIIWLDRIIPD